MKEKYILLHLLFLATGFFAISSCMPNIDNGIRSRSNSSAIASGTANVGIGQGRILSDNPIILSKDSSIDDTFNLNRLLTTDVITTGPFLKGSSSCYGLEYCFEVRANKNSLASLQTTNGKWAFDVYSTEFLQVNTFFHLNKITKMFYENLTASYSRSFDTFSNPYYDSPLPLGLVSSPHVFKGYNTPLMAYSNCDAASNANFDPANLTLCFGYDSNHPKIMWAQDSSVIYHEAGHSFQKLQLNFRNYANIVKVDLGNISYNEAGSIGEGLSDFYSYYINGRPHLAEWAAGKFHNASRPMTESDSLYGPEISTDPDQRLSYPQYLGFNPNQPTVLVEEIHNNGMILSHYLVALASDLQDKCAMTKREASDLVVHLISDTLAEHGDLSSKGTEKNLTGNPKINLNSNKSFEWFTIVNPINYRTFMQTFAKNILNNLGNSMLNRCNGSIYTKDQIESLIDQYGLLLFRTYNENRNLAVPGSVNNTTINALNRKKSVLISKSLLILDPTTNASSAFVIDDRTIISEGITSLKSHGSIGSLSSQTPSDLGFNNSNGKVSPGEVVAIALNIYNNSNSPMAGIQILANDWYHANASGSPCQFSTAISNDQWPLISEGGVPCPLIKAEVPADFTPICFIQSNESNATKWISQTDFKTKMALESSSCLDPTNDKNCFIRTIPGADQANFSKINPKTTWAKTFANPTSGVPQNFEWGNVILFEVSKHIPPGTLVDCRMRLRFTNCDDCYHDSSRSNYDYIDTDYNGPRPYKVIHLQMPIID